MTTTTADATSLADHDVGHPVRSFVLVLVALAVLLVGVQILGVAQLRVAYSTTSGARQGSGSMWQVVVIRNEGVMPVRILSISWPVTGIDDAITGVLPPGKDAPTHGSAAGTAPLSEPFTLDGGEQRGLVVSGVERCAGSFGADPVRVRARTLVGIERTVEIEHVDFDPAIGC